MHYTATYSPEDNKLRLYASSRLDAETYARVKAAGFSWAPRQELFVAPMWTPDREDLLLELAGEIDDEDKSLVERAEERADRFEDYSERRGVEAASAERAVSAIADGIPFGQPILVGHHSERRARKDKERIENGMRKAIRLWETKSYWTARAAGAIKAAKYKEVPAVRYRRIKGLEADARKQAKAIESSEHYLARWAAAVTVEDAKAIANYDHAGSLASVWSRLDKGEMTADEARAIVVPIHERAIVHHRRWLDHYENRLAYERAMLEEQGGIVADKFDIQPGGRVCRRGTWLLVQKVNRRDGKLFSVTVVGHFAATVSADEITDYRPPAEGDAEKIAAATKLPPLVNRRTPGCLEMTAAKWKWYAGRRDDVRGYPVKATAEHGAYRERRMYGEGFKMIPVFITDAKEVQVPPPAAAPAPLPVARPEDAPIPPPRAFGPRPERPEERLRDALRRGVVAVSAPELFPTPPELAARLVEVADVSDDHHVLEPSAGTGALLAALPKGANVTAVERDRALADRLRQSSATATVYPADFLELELPPAFDRVVMNPPFSAEVEHVERAFGLLRPGGKLAAILSAGAKFRMDKKYAALREKFTSIEDLPEGSFAASGTQVRTVLVTMEKSA